MSHRPVSDQSTIVYHPWFPEHRNAHFERLKNSGKLQDCDALSGDVGRKESQLRDLLVAHVRGNWSFLSYTPHDLIRFLYQNPLRLFSSGIPTDNIAAARQEFEVTRGRYDQECLGYPSSLPESSPVDAKDAKDLRVAINTIPYLPPGHRGANYRAYFDTRQNEAQECDALYFRMKDSFRAWQAELNRSAFWAHLGSLGFLLRAHVHNLVGAGSPQIASDTLGSQYFNLLGQYNQRCLPNLSAGEPAAAVASVRIDALPRVMPDESVALPATVGGEVFLPEPPPMLALAGYGALAIAMGVVAVGTVAAGEVAAAGTGLAPALVAGGVAVKPAWDAILWGLRLVAP